MADLVDVGSAHAGVIAALHAACFDETVGDWNEWAVGDMFAMPGVFGSIASTDRDPVGFVVARSAADEAEIISIGVLESARRQGLASQLLTRTLEHLQASGCAHLFLEVAADNTAAETFYRARGFVEGGRRKDYYRRADGRMDALILRLDLT